MVVKEHGAKVEFIRDGTLFLFFQNKVKNKVKTLFILILRENTLFGPNTILVKQKKNSDHFTKNKEIKLNFILYR